MKENILKTNKLYWDTNADDWFGSTSLPTLGVMIPDEEELNLFGDVAGTKLLDIGCGSGHSLKYHADRGAEELWGLDMSTSQIKNAQRYLSEQGYDAELFNAPMEADVALPEDYFDTVYSIYAIGWTTDLQGTFNKIASYLKTGGKFIFSWDHPFLRKMDFYIRDMYGFKLREFIRNKL